MSHGLIKHADFAAMVASTIVAAVCAVRLQMPERITHDRVMLCAGCAPIDIPELFAKKTPISARVG